MTHKSMSPCNLYIFFWTFHGSWLLQIDKGLISGTLLKASDISVWCKLINFLIEGWRNLLSCKFWIRNFIYLTAFWLYWITGITGIFLKHVGLADMYKNVYNFLCLSELKDQGQRFLFTKGHVLFVLSSDKEFVL